MDVNRARIFPLAAALSISNSVVLAVVPFAIPGIPIGFLIASNWLFFMLLGYAMLPPAPFLLGRPPIGPERDRWNVWRLALVAFSASSLFALLNSERIF